MSVIGYSMPDNLIIKKLNHEDLLQNVSFFNDSTFYNRIQINFCWFSNKFW